MNHWISFSNRKHDGVYSLINKKPIYAIYNANSQVEQVSEVKNINLIGYIIYSNNIFKIPEEFHDCIEFNTYFISKTEVLIQFLNKQDPFFNTIGNSCNVILNSLSTNVKRYSLNGIEKNEFKNSQFDQNKIIIRQLQFEAFIITFK